MDIFGGHGWSAVRGGPQSPLTLVERIAGRLNARPPGAHDPAWQAEPDPQLRLGDPGSAQPAAVLVPVVLRGGEASLLFTRRNASLRHHSGQIAFPGGKIDVADAGAAAAALREAGEEIGLDPAAVTVLGYLDTHLSGSGFRVVPVVATLNAPYAMAINPSEVDEVFEVPLLFLMDAANHRIASLERDGRTRHFYEMRFGDYVIWGVTAGIVRALYERLYA